MEFVTSDIDEIKHLRKYTTLPILLDILTRKKITFLKPNSWQDKNDVKVMEHYQSLNKEKIVLASCFSYGPESVYHWNSFSDGPAGCMLEFKFNKLMERLQAYNNLLCGKVDYLWVDDVKNKKYNLNKLPFLKRYPYQCEDEFRMVLFADKDMDSYEVDIDFSCISSIKISPNLPKTVADSVKKILKNIVNSPNIKVCQSTLLENKKWIKYCSQITK